MRRLHALLLLGAGGLGGGTVFFACGGSDSPPSGGTPSAEAGDERPGITGAGADTGAILDAPDTMTLKGKVVDDFNVPSPGVSVSVKGKPTATTGADGSFTIADVKAPYDLMVVDVTRKIGIEVRGLHRADPVVRTNLVLPQKVARLNADLVNMPEFQAANSRVTMAFGSPDAVGTFGYDGPNQDFNPRYIPGIRWWTASASTTGTMHVVQLQHDAGTPTAYVRYGASPNVTLSAGADAGTTISMGAVGSTGHLTGSVSMQAGYVIRNIAVDAVVNQAPIALGGYSNGFIGTQFDLLTPDLAGAKMQLQVTTEKGNDQSITILRGLAFNATGVTVNVPTAPSAVSPADGTTGVTTANAFSWTGPSNAVYVVTFYSSGGNVPGSFQVVTTETTAHIPDTTALGVALPKNETMEWQVKALGPYPTVDDYAVAPPATPRALDTIGLANAIGFTSAP